VSGDASEQRVEHPATKAGAGFPRAARLLKHSDFERVYKQGRRHFSSHMTVFYLRRAEEAGLSGTDLLNTALSKTGLSKKSSRVGFTVGRVLGGAVQRNRIKRRLREAVRQRRAVLTGTGGIDAIGVDIVINPKTTVLSANYRVVLEEVGRALDAIAKKLAEK
jgi:ribonuclease P protein component